MRDDVAEVRQGQPGKSVEQTKHFSPWICIRCLDDEEAKRVASARTAGNGPTEVATEVEEALREDWDQVSQEAAADTP